MEYMRIVKRYYRGKEISVVYDCPCDRCNKHNYCKTNKMYCSAFTEYVNNGWFKPTSLQQRLKRL